MAWEAGGMCSARRMRLAQLALRQRVPQDPLDGANRPGCRALPDRRATTPRSPP